MSLLNQEWLRSSLKTVGIVGFILSLPFLLSIAGFLVGLAIYYIAVRFVIGRFM